MNPRIQLLFGMAGLSAVITYAWWLRQRVWRLRGDLFVIRDEFWTEMAELGLLDDPSHRKFRDGINAVIRVAPALSILTMFRLVIDVDELRHIGYDPEHFLDHQVQQDTAPKVLQARWRMCCRIASYLIVETLSGWIFFVFFKLAVMRRGLRDHIARKIEELFDNGVFDQYNSDLSPIHREHIKFG